MQLGVCWYPEHWPQAWWADDVRQMAELGITHVRIGEFAWSRLEPSPGTFDWAWLDTAIELLAAAGRRVVLGTPTATPPRWVVDRDPSMLPVGLDGQVRRFGSRRHYCFSHLGYEAEALRITREMASRYGRHPAVVAWQVDNEYGCHDTVQSLSPAAQARFRDWLRARYGNDISALNRAWGAVFWSQELSGFEAAEPPFLTVTEANPAQRLDWRRFASDEVRRFNRAQVALLRELSPGRTLLHNVMLFFTEFDHRALASDLDLLGWDSYPLGALENFWFDEATKRRWLHSGHPDFAAFHHDLYRGMSRRPFWVMEQQPGPVNWGAWNPAPASGMVRLWTWEAFAHGADLVSYFRWRQAPFAQEQMHAGLQAPDRSTSPGGHEAAAVARELARVPAMPGRRAPVALVFDYPSRWAMQIQPQGADEDALRIAFDAYAALRGLALDIDIVGPDDDLEGYALLVLPAQVLADDALVERLSSTSAQIFLYPRCGAKTPSLAVPDGLPPGPLRRLIDLRVLQVESLRPGVTCEVIPTQKARTGGHHHRWQGARWREHLQAGPSVQVLALFADGTGPALLRDGRVRYMATRPASAGAERELLAAAASEAGLSPVLLPDGLRVRRRGDLLFAMNYDTEPHRLEVAQAEWLLGGPLIAPHGVSVARRAAP